MTKNEALEQIRKGKRALEVAERLLLESELIEHGLTVLSTDEGQVLVRSDGGLVISSRQELKQDSMKRYGAKMWVGASGKTCDACNGTGVV